MILFMNPEKVFDKVQHTFIIKPGVAWDKVPTLFLKEYIESAYGFNSLIQISITFSELGKAILRLMWKHKRPQGVKIS